MNLLYVLGLVEFVRGALIFSLLPLYGVLVAKYSLDLISSAIALHYLLDNICRLPVGWITDRIGGKWLMSAGVFLSSIGVYLLYTHWSVTFFMLGAVIFGIGVSPVWPVVISGIAAKVPLNKLGEALSKVFMAWLIGAGLGPVLINFVINWSYPMAFWILIVVLGGAFLLILFTKVPKISLKKQSSSMEFFKELLKEIASIKLLYPGMFVQTMSIGILIPILALYARSVFGFNSVQLNYLLIGCGAFTIILLIPAGKIVDRIGIKGPLVGGFSLAAISLVLLPLQSNFALVLIVGVFLGISYSFILPSWNGLMARAVSPEKRGTMWAVFMTIEGLGTSLGVYVGGKMWESFGHQSPFFASAFVLGTMSIFYMFSNLNKLMVEGSRGNQNELGI